MCRMGSTTPTSGPNPTRPIWSLSRDALPDRSSSRSRPDQRGDGAGRALPFQCRRRQSRPSCPRDRDLADRLLLGTGHRAQCGLRRPALRPACRHLSTKLPSLELGLQAARSAGNCDQGFSCAYHAHISWRSPTQPNPRELNPRAVFDRLFASTALSGSKRLWRGVTQPQHPGPGDGQCEIPQRPHQHR
jgi:hypothetical protein